MTTIGLIRHGSTSWNKEGRAQGHTNNPLDQEGFIQAERLAERLLAEKWDLIYSSDLLRARQTAETIADKLGITEIHYDKGLREMSAGQIEGTTNEERIARWGINWKEQELGIEAAAIGGTRGSQCIKEIAARHPGCNILVVSHGALLRNSLRLLTPEQNVEVLLGNTSITILKWTNEEWSCQLYNCTVHLEQS